MPRPRVFLRERRIPEDVTFSWWSALPAISSNVRSNFGTSVRHVKSGSTANASECSWSPPWERGGHQRQQEPRSKSRTPVLHTPHDDVSTSIASPNYAATADGSAATS